MFKVGDKVRRKEPSHNPNVFGQMGIVYTIDKVISSGSFSSKEGIKISCIDKYWEIVKEPTHFPLYSEEAAVKLLTERGYEVKAPPEPLKGKAYILKGGSGNIWATTDPSRWGDVEVIAIVDWTEGEGI